MSSVLEFWMVISVVVEETKKKDVQELFGKKKSYEKKKW